MFSWYVLVRSILICVRCCIWSEIMTFSTNLLGIKLAVLRSILISVRLSWLFSWLIVNLTLLRSLFRRFSWLFGRMFSWEILISNRLSWLFSWLIANLTVLRSFFRRIFSWLFGILIYDRLAFYFLKLVL